MAYFPLNVKTSYSILQSTLTIDRLIQHALKHNSQAVAICDVDVCYGALELYKKAKQHHLKALIGLSSQIEYQNGQFFEFAVFPQNNEALKQIYRLSSLIQTEKLSVQAFSDFIAGSNNQNYIIKDQDMDEEKEGWIETLFDSLPASNQIYKGVEAGSSRLSAYFSSYPDLAFDCFNHGHSNEQLAVGVLEAISQAQQVSLDELSQGCQQQKNHSLDVRAELESQHSPSAIAHTESFVSSIEIEIDLHQNKLAEFDCPPSYQSADYLQFLSWRALEEKGLDSKVYKDRLDKELKLIIQLGFADYFLIVWDIIAYAKAHSIQTGPGRGSAAGSLVAYVLGIIDVDPIRYDLIFERFLNPERSSPPDIDLDFPDNKRQQIIHYIRKKYGSDHVAQIITFGSLGAKQALRDTGRVLSLSQQELNDWSKRVPSTPSISLQEAYKESEPLRKKVKESEFNRQLYTIAGQIEGLIRNTSTHASGLIIARGRLVESIPLQASKQDLVQSQWAMDDLESLGFIKFDILGLKNLTILNDALSFIQADHSFDLNKIDLSDSVTFKLFQRADTNGVFQFESKGIKRVLKRLQPNQFEDIVAVIALYRPGPMNEIANYIDRKQGRQEINYLHADLEAILSKTKGIMIYQEQVMQIAQKMASYQLGEADLFRRAISKKDSQLIEAEREKFSQRALKNGYHLDVVEAVFHAIERFADYGFNRSHAVAYSLLAYQLAYIKVHFPHAFYAALLRSSQSNKYQSYLLEGLKKELNIEAPHVNKSQQACTARQGRIILGFDQLKVLKNTTRQAIIKNREQDGPYEDCIDTLQRVQATRQQKKEWQALIYAGGFDGMGEDRGTLLNSLDAILDNLDSGQFSPTLADIFQPQYQTAPDLNPLQAAEKEIEYLSISLNGHPNLAYRELRYHFNWSYLLEENQGRHCFLVAFHQIKTIQTRQGDMMAFVKVSDESELLEAVLFPNLYRRFSPKIEEGQLYLLSGQLENKNKKKQLLVNDIKSVDQIEEASQHSVFIQVSDLSVNLYKQIQHFVKNRPGYSPVYIYDKGSKKTYKFKANLYFSIQADYIKQLKAWLGEENIVVKMTP